MKKLIIGLLALPVSVQAFFTDTQNYDWEESVNYLAELEVIGGYPDGSFKPDQPINRAEFTKIVMGSVYDLSPEDAASCFNDIDASAWYAPYVCLAKDEGIISGYSDGSFRPSQNVNQAEALKILYETFYDGIEDTGGQWYQKYLDAAEFDGMLYFNVENPAAQVLTRGQMAYFTAWMLDEEATLSDEIAFSDFYGEDYEAQDWGWEAMTSEDCFEDEYYDEADRQCYLLEDEYDYQVEEGLFSDFDWSSLYHPDHEASAPISGETVTYHVNNDELIPQDNTASGKSLLTDTTAHQRVWQRFTELIPSQNRNAITQVLFFNDGDDNTAAYVEPRDQNLQTWTLGINLDGLFDETGAWLNTTELNLTLIHEFAHVLTLNHTQVNPEQTEQACSPQFYTGEGCARPTAFINLFFKKFWTRAMYQTVLEDPDYGGETIYAQHPRKFVTDYAATNPGEDIAETFAYFVTQTKPQSCEASITEQKLCFMYQFPALVTLRKNIRSGLQ